MGSRLYTNVRSLIDSLEIATGDVVLLHSDMGNLVHLSAPDELSTQTDARHYLLSSFHAALSDAVGPQGTICVLGSFNDYARFGKPFILEDSPPDKDLGAYPRFLLRQEDIHRSLNPLAGIISKGRQAGWICQHRSAFGYGPESPWSRILELGGKMVFWGVGLGSMTFVHHVEQLAGVPHMYNKLHPTPVCSGGKRIDFPVITAVRFLKYNVVYNLTKFQNDLRNAGKVLSVRKNGLEVQLTTCEDVMDHLITALARDPFYLLDHPPEFVAGEVPTDGPAGPLDSRLARRS